MVEGDVVFRFETERVGDDSPICGPFGSRNSSKLNLRLERGCETAYRVAPDAKAKGGWPAQRFDAARFAEVWPPDVNLVGKDILRFHAVYWPAMLMAAGLEPPRKVFAHGWLLVGGEKMSKTTGNVVNPLDLIDEIGVDGFRYYVLADTAYGNDGDFTYEGLIGRYNSDLANNLGNLAARVAYSPAEADAPRPDFAVMVYPAYLFEKDKPDSTLREGSDGVIPPKGVKPVPAFFAHSADDGYPAEGSMALAKVLKSMGGSTEVHVWAKGGHGWGAGDKLYGACDCVLRRQ